jgi:8-oxo-dGTP diphosphatase
MKPNFQAEITNMVMVYDRQRDAVVVQDRRKYWTGYAFPGGHMEPGESFAAAAIREVYEETGLQLQSVQCCGLIHWDQPEGKYLVYLYRSDAYSGQLIDQTDEGSVQWMPLQQLRNLQQNQPERLAKNFPMYLKIFLDQGYHELFAKKCPQQTEFTYL